MGLLQLAYRNFFHDHCLYRTFFGVKSLAGGWGDGFYCCNLNLDTRHNLIAWNMLQTNNCFAPYNRFASLTAAMELDILCCGYSRQLVHSIFFAIGIPTLVT